jgi:hypothetical protein
MNEPRNQPIGWKLRLLDMVGFQLGWFACVLGTAADNPWIGPLIVAILVSLHLAVLASRWHLLRLVLLAAVLGIAMDGLMLLLGVFAFQSSALPIWISPLWLTAMWVNFSLTLRVSMSWLLDRYLLGALLGSVSGPAAYYAGAKLGAISFQTTLPVAFLVLAVVWSISLPLLTYWAGKESR